MAAATEARILCRRHPATTNGTSATPHPGGAARRKSEPKTRRKWTPPPPPPTDDAKLEADDARNVLGIRNYRVAYIISFRFIIWIVILDFFSFLLFSLSLNCREAAPSVLFGAQLNTTYDATPRHIPCRFNFNVHSLPHVVPPPPDALVEGHKQPLRRAFAQTPISSSNSIRNTDGC